VAEIYDAIIVGGGPAGLSAAIIGALRGMKILIIESGSFGGPLASLYPEKLVLNYPGFPVGILAKDLAHKFVAQAKGLDIDMRFERALKITDKKEVLTDEGNYSGKSVIITTGSKPREVGILGEMEFNSGDRGVHYYVTDPEKFRDKVVLVVGGGDTAIDSVLALEGIAKKLTLAHRKDSFRAYAANVKKVVESSRIDVFLETQIKEIKGEEKVNSAVLFGKDGKTIEVEADSVILAFGLVPNNEIFSDLGLKLDYEGRIETDPGQKTNLDGFYAAGDIVAGTGSLELIVVAVAQGAIAAHNAYLETATPYWG
jgi:thioredoxin reductase (NADPH)